MVHLRTVLVILLSLPLRATGEVAPTGTLRAAFLGGNPVQARIDSQTGAITGPAPDVIRELARRRGVPFTLMPQPNAAAVIAQVRSGQADIGFLAYEAERAQEVDFSEPYALMASAFLVKADSPIRTSADVDRAGLRVGAVTGQSQQIFVSATMRAATVVLLPVMPSDAEAAAMLERGTIHAWAANRQRMAEIARSSTGVRILGDNFLMVGQAMIVPKGEVARLADLNRFVEDLRASEFVQASIERSGLTGNVEAAPRRPDAR